MPGTKSWLAEVEMTRGAAILAVLLIHVTGLPVRSFPAGSPAHTFYALLNEGAQFAVPLFLLISALLAGYGLGAPGGAGRAVPGGSPAPGDRIDWAGFYRKKWRQVAVPYLIWTTFYLVADVLVVGDRSHLTAAGLARTYLLGEAWFHLYFMSVLFQFYVLLPLLVWFFRQARPGFGTTFVVFGLAQYGLYWVNRLYIYHHFPFTGSLVISYLFPLAMGLWFGLSRDRWDEWWRTWGPAVPAAAVGAGVAYVLLQLRAAAGIAVSTLAIRMSWYLYVTAVGLGILFLCRSATRRGAIPRFLAAAGRVSFGLYLIHPAFLALWRAAVAPASPAVFHACVLGSYLFTLAASWVAVVLIEHTWLGGPLLGGRRGPQRTATAAPAGAVETPD